MGPAPATIRSDRPRPVPVTVDGRSVRHPAVTSAARPGDSGRPDGGLTRQDIELLRLLADGALIGAVARKLRTSDRTVRRRVRHICDRLGVATPIQAVVWAARRGLL